MILRVVYKDNASRWKVRVRNAKKFSFQKWFARIFQLRICCFSFPLQLFRFDEGVFKESLQSIQEPFGFFRFNVKNFPSILAFHGMRSKIADVPNCINGLGQVWGISFVVQYLFDLTRKISKLHSGMFSQELLQTSPTQGSASFWAKLQHLARLTIISGKTGRNTYCHRLSAGILRLYHTVIQDPRRVSPTGIVLGIKSAPQFSKKKRKSVTLWTVESTNDPCPISLIDPIVVKVKTLFANIDFIPSYVRFLPAVSAFHHGRISLGANNIMRVARTIGQIG